MSRSFVCDGCQQDFRCTSSRGRLPSRCDDCRASAHTKYVAEYRRRHRGQQGVCDDCGESFTIGSHKNVCGRCYSLRVYPITKRRGRRSHRKPGFAAIKKKLVEAADVCALCGDALDKECHWTEPLSPNVDHIVQRCDGGSDDLANLRVVHRRCNDAWSKTVPKYRLAAARGALLLKARGF